FGHGQEIHYELHKIEAELAYNLLYKKEIRALIQQEQIPTEKLGFFTANTFTSTINRNSYHILNTSDTSLIFDNPATLLSELEILLSITENLQFHQVVSGLKLKHVVALYELVEEKIADVEIYHLSDNYKADLSRQMKDEINAFVDFEQSHVVGRSGIKLSKIPYRTFEQALKRFMFRYLSSELYSPDEKLTKYLAENNDEKNSSDCWPLWVSNVNILDKFPKSLLIANIYKAYTYITQSVKKSNSHKTNNSLQNNSRQNKNRRSKPSNTTNTGTNSRNKQS
ncbi:12534_t:CDS:2, partial [Dentiscutata heterogama]